MTKGFRSASGVGAVLVLLAIGLAACSSSSSSSTTTTSGGSSATTATTSGGGGDGSQTFHGTAALTGSTPLSGTWTGTGSTASCAEAADNHGAGYQLPGGGNVGSQNLQISVAVEPSVYKGPGTYSITIGAVNPSGGDSYSFSATNPASLKVNADGSGSLTFTGAQSLNAVSGNVTGTESGAISWTCSN